MGPNKTKRNLSVVLLLLTLLSGCEWGSFTSIGQGFKYGYVHEPRDATIYYEDTGIIDGHCYKVLWNDTLALVFNHPNVDGEIRKDVTNYYLLDKTQEKDVTRMHFYPGLKGPLTYMQVFGDRGIKVEIFTERESY